MTLSRAKRLLVSCGFLTPSAAFALGDPAVIWWGIGAVAIQVITAALLSWLPIFKPFRRTALIAYLLLLLIAWSWGLNVAGPDFAHVYAVLLGGPVAFLLCAAGTVLMRKA